MELKEVVIMLALFLQDTIATHGSEDIFLQRQKRELKIYHGHDAEPGSLPYQVSIQSPLRDGHFCGGSIISLYYILSAGHCFAPEADGVSDPRSVFVIAGITHLNDTSSEGRQEKSVSKIIIHPLFRIIKRQQEGESDKIDNDIAILRLAGALLFTNFVKPITLPMPGANFTGMNCTTSGWGHTEWSLVNAPNTLQEVEIPVTRNKICAKYHENFDATTQLCSQEETYEPALCNGDSGGPLACNVTAVQYLAGVASLGNNCTDLVTGEPKIPTKIFALISFYTEWIKSVVKI